MLPGGGSYETDLAARLSVFEKDSIRIRRSAASETQYFSRLLNVKSAVIVGSAAIARWKYLLAASSLFEHKERTQ